MENRSTYFLPKERFDEIRQKYPKFNEPWSNEEVNTLVEMCAHNTSKKEMSIVLGRSPKSVKLKLLEMGLLKKSKAGKQWTKKEDQLLMQGYSEGMSFLDMAETFQISVEEIITRLVNLRMNIFEEELMHAEAMEYPL